MVGRGQGKPGEGGGENEGGEKQGKPVEWGEGGRSECLGGEGNEVRVDGGGEPGECGMGKPGESGWVEGQGKNR